MPRNHRFCGIFNDFKAAQRKKPSISSFAAITNPVDPAVKSGHETPPCWTNPTGGLVHQIIDECLDLGGCHGLRCGLGLLHLIVPGLGIALLPNNKKCRPEIFWFPGGISSSAIVKRGFSFMADRGIISLTNFDPAGG